MANIHQLKVSCTFLYDPFGMIAVGRNWVSGTENYRYNFQGQEQDEELWSGAISFQYRIENIRLGRFFSVDPLEKKYPYYSPYAFSGNEVIASVEIEGLEPGKLFNTQQSAAEDFAFHYNDRSIRINQEYGTTIFSVNTELGVKFSYLEPNVGTSGSSVRPSRVGFFDSWSKTEVAIAHTHAAYSFKKYDDNNFSTSGGDIDYAENEGLDIYVATPNGSLKYYSVSTNTTLTVRTDIPSDNSDPNQLNPNSTSKSYNNIINLGNITFNSDFARKSKKGNWLIVTDIESGKDYGVVRDSKTGTYTFKSN